MMNDKIEEVLRYWFEPKPKTEAEVEARRVFWFEGSEAIDREITTRFSDLFTRATKGELASWQETPRGVLALTILLDQFSRNLRRGTPEAFAYDEQALNLVKRGYASGMFKSFDLFERMFVALPFRHAEDVENQKRAVDLAIEDAMTCADHEKAFAIYSVDWARKHLDVIVRFGRFPHRNRALGRTSTKEEEAYVAYLKRAGQWL